MEAVSAMGASSKEVDNGAAVEKVRASTEERAPRLRKLMRQPNHWQKWHKTCKTSSINSKINGKT